MSSKGSSDKNGKIWPVVITLVIATHHITTKTDPDTTLMMDGCTQKEIKVYIKFLFVLPFYILHPNIQDVFDLELDQEYLGKKSTLCVWNITYWPEGFSCKSEYGKF